MFERLPIEILDCIFASADTSTLTSLNASCRTLYRLTLPYLRFAKEHAKLDVCPNQVNGYPELLRPCRPGPLMPCLPGRSFESAWHLLRHIVDNPWLAKYVLYINYCRHSCSEQLERLETHAVDTETPVSSQWDSSVYTFHGIADVDDGSRRQMVVLKRLWSTWHDCHDQVKHRLQNRRETTQWPADWASHFEVDTDMKHDVNALIFSMFLLRNVRQVARFWCGDLNNINRETGVGLFRLMEPLLTKGQQAGLLPDLSSFAWLVHGDNPNRVQRPWYLSLSRYSWEFIVRKVFGASLPTPLQSLTVIDQYIAHEDVLAILSEAVDLGRLSLMHGALPSDVVHLRDSQLATRNCGNTLTRLALKYPTEGSRSAPGPPWLTGRDVQKVLEPLCRLKSLDLDLYPYRIAPGIGKLINILPSTLEMLQIDLGFQDSEIIEEMFWEFWIDEPEALPHFKQLILETVHTEWLVKQCKEASRAMCYIRHEHESPELQTNTIITSRSAGFHHRSFILVSGTGQ